MRTLLVAGAAALLAGCATSPWVSETGASRLALNGVEPKTGGHCESSAMLNALHYLGYDLAESDIIGGGAAPSFMLSNDGFPFIGSRNETMRETFFAAARIPYEVAVPANAAASWNGVYELLGRSLPVLLRVDMRYLPYLYGGKYGPSYMSFGWHWICLLGVDMAASEALVTDTGMEGLQRIRLADLDKARSSNTKVWPPRREYAWVEAKPADWKLDPDALARSAIAGVLANYEGKGGWEAAATSGAAEVSGVATASALGAAEVSGTGTASAPSPATAPSAATAPGAATAPSAATSTPHNSKASAAIALVGLEGLGLFSSYLERIDQSVSPYALAPAYSYMAATIEKNGTGGSAFRRLFLDFLEARAADCADPRLREACAALLDPARHAAEAWSALATSFELAAVAIQAAHGSAARAEAIATAKRNTAAKAGALHAAEASLCEALREALLAAGEAAPATSASR
jgi:hypothetical protein